MCWKWDLIEHVPESGSFVCNNNKPVSWPEMSKYLFFLWTNLSQPTASLSVYQASRLGTGALSLAVPSLQLFLVSACAEGRKQPRFELLNHIQLHYTLDLWKGRAFPIRKWQRSSQPLLKHPFSGLLSPHRQVCRAAETLSHPTGI